MVQWSELVVRLTSIGVADVVTWRLGMNSAAFLGGSGAPVCSETALVTFAPPHRGSGRSVDTKANLVSTFSASPGADRGLGQYGGSTAA